MQSTAKACRRVLPLRGDVALLGALLFVGLSGCQGEAVGTRCQAMRPALVAGQPSCGADAGCFTADFYVLDDTARECPTNRCLVWNWDENGHPEEAEKRSFCTCRCGGAGSGPMCTCPSGFTCTNVISVPGHPLSGAYCIRNTALERTEPLSCAGTMVPCRGRCVETQSSTEHCGVCNRACPPGIPCVNGSCGCPSGQTACGGGCADLANDPMHCGACGTVCDSSCTPMSCQSGRCVAARCPSPQETCGGAQVCTFADPLNCGRCGNVCPSGRCCRGQCLP